MRTDREPHYDRLLRVIRASGELGMTGPQLSTRFGNGTHKALARLREQGLVERAVDDGRTYRWRALRVRGT